MAYQAQPHGNAPKQPEKDNDDGWCEDNNWDDAIQFEEQMKAQFAAVAQNGSSANADNTTDEADDDGWNLASSVKKMSINKSDTSGWTKRRDYNWREKGGGANSGARGFGGGRGGARPRYNNHNANTKKPQTPAEPLLILEGEAARKWIEDQRIKAAEEWSKVDYKAMLAESDRVAAEKWAKYPPITKDLYKEHPAVANMTPHEVEKFREENNGITVQIPPGAPEPAEETPASSKPSPIQAQAWPLILKGHDIIGVAQTGSGKTLAFLLPAYAHLMSQPRQRRVPGASILIMAPTRELALQINEEVLKFKCCNINSVVVYGGADRNDQIRQIKQGCNIIIATPGRLDDLVTAGHIDITSVTYVVLDEADRMLDAGFEAVIRRTMYKIRPDRQTIMTSATWPDGVRRLANSYMKNPLQVIVGTLDLTAVATIAQSFVFLNDDDAEEKLVLLLDFARCHKNQPNLKVVVFCSTKARATYISTELAMNDVFAYCLRGDMDQSDRELALEVIKNGETQYLIATDVASRGIDIPDLTHVINLDFPRDIEEYVHRIGRTGRAGKTGKSVTFMCFKDSKHAKALIKILEKAEQIIPAELHRYVVKHERYMERRRMEGTARPPRSRYSDGF
ncbi:uncharacterized protein [Atheta coriaria]|uniref:uncharacterized protein n=1 Tax=Dalotia coriaria TaxID=877792 RepID=UPI0031F3D5BA